MSSGFVLPPTSGRLVRGGALDITVKVGGDRSRDFSAFEARVPPGFDVGAHRHAAGEEMFLVLEGELEMFAFDPQPTSDADWRTWSDGDGQRVSRGGPGTVMFIPSGCAHGFRNETDEVARVFFVVSPVGHEDYLRELADLLATTGPDVAAIDAIRSRHGIEQLTPMRPGRPVDLHHTHPPVGDRTIS